MTKPETIGHQYAKGVVWVHKDALWHHLHPSNRSEDPEQLKTYFRDSSMLLCTLMIYSSLGSPTRSTLQHWMKGSHSRRRQDYMWSATSVSLWPQMSFLGSPNPLRGITSYGWLSPSDHWHAATSQRLKVENVPWNDQFLWEIPSQPLKAPLYRLLRKEVQWRWRQKERRHMKQPRHYRSCQIYSCTMMSTKTCDALQYGLGAVLSQRIRVLPRTVQRSAIFG